MKKRPVKKKSLPPQKLRRQRNKTRDNRLWLKLKILLLLLMILFLSLVFILSIKYYSVLVNTGTPFTVKQQKVLQKIKFDFYNDLPTT